MSQLSTFYLPWAAALAASATEPAATAGATLIQFEGMSLPVVQAALAVAGVLMARPLAPRRKQESGWARQILVTAIMMLVALAWVAQSQPGVLFTFVVAIGLGFSGYALVETAGTETENFVKRIFARVSDALGSALRQAQDEREDKL